MTRKGQVTIPAEIRDRLHLNEGDVFLVREEDGKVIFESQVELVRRTAGSLAKYAKNIPPLEPEEMGELAAQAIADEVWDSMQDEIRQREESHR